MFEDENNDEELDEIFNDIIDNEEFEEVGTFPFDLEELAEITKRVNEAGWWLTEMLYDLIEDNDLDVTDDVVQMSRALANMADAFIDELDMSHACECEQCQEDGENDDE